MLFYYLLSMLSHAMQEIASVKAAQHLADDENASRWIVSIASALLSVA